MLIILPQPKVSQTFLVPGSQDFRHRPVREERHFCFMGSRIAGAANRDLYNKIAVEL